MNALVSSRSGTAATALAVSWLPGVTTTAPEPQPTWLATSGFSSSRTVPGATSGGRRCVGTPKSASRAGRPAARPAVQHLGGRGDGVLANLAAGQPVVEQVRQHQEGARNLQLGIVALGHAEKLVEGTILRDLDSGFLEDPGGGHAAQTRARACLRSGGPDSGRGCRSGDRRHPGGRSPRPRYRHPCSWRGPRTPPRSGPGRPGSPTTAAGRPSRCARPRGPGRWRNDGASSGGTRDPSH